LRKIAVFLIALLAAVSMPIQQAQAQSILRDAETEAFLRHVSEPIFEAAGLTPSSVRIYLLSDKSLNAFVTGGQNIFIHSGLIMASDDINQLLGVIAHETGHISGGHLARMGDAAQSAGNLSIISMVLGAAAILAGGGDAGMGIMMAGQSVAQRSFLSYSRVQESAADQAGAQFLTEAGISGRGLIEFFGKLRNQEILAQVRQDPYVRSHPLNRQRMSALEQEVTSSPHYNKAPDANINEAFDRLKAKIVGYLDHPVQTLRKYPVSDTSVSARYARVYAYHKALEWDLALAEADELIKVEPNNPYFHEIKGQILFENGKVPDALPVLTKATELAPKEPLVATALGQAMVSLEDKEMMAKAIPILENAVRLDSENSFAWFNLAKAYSWMGDDAKANLATAERFYSMGNPMLALTHAKRAVDDFKQGTPEWLRAQDIIYVSEEAAEKFRKRQKRRRRASEPSFSFSKNQ
jgi:predicted Zn-dependent protease